MEHQRSVARFIKSDALPPSPGYSQVVEVRPGRIIYIAHELSCTIERYLSGDVDNPPRTLFTGGGSASWADYLHRRTGIARSCRKARGRRGYARAGTTGF